MTTERKKKKVKPKQEACKRLCEPLLSLKSEVTELHQKLEERKKIEKAKWLLVKKRGINEEMAHALLLAESQNKIEDWQRSPKAFWLAAGY